MALMKCSECGGAVSSAAEACPHCGNPMRGRPDVVGGRQVQTIEKTSKSFKGVLLVFILMIFVGVAWKINGIGERAEPRVWDAALIVIGLIGAVITKISIWWHHG